eukprot:TRINITY_DN826_c0_g1_i1.p1 TRINITY_DN826_c0_g1~~TRINITY_DN826_c0_g1_i1.p1  ORF type:complete len:147 (+),score=24.77 TRINITY_DN826_c0_g1_i1:103-543(+)
MSLKVYVKLQKSDEEARSIRVERNATFVTAFDVLKALVDAKTFPQLHSNSQQVDFWRNGKLLDQFAEIHDRDALEIFVSRSQKVGRKSRSAHNSLRSGSVCAQSLDIVKSAQDLLNIPLPVSRAKSLGAGDRRAVPLDEALGMESS